jgi:hypothetical protein
VVHPGLAFFRPGAGGGGGRSPINYRDVPGLKESGWTPEMDEMCVVSMFFYSPAGFFWASRWDAVESDCLEVGWDTGCSGLDVEDGNDGLGCQALRPCALPILLALAVPAHTVPQWALSNLLHLTRLKAYFSLIAGSLTLSFFRLLQFYHRTSGNMRMLLASREPYDPLSSVLRSIPPTHRMTQLYAVLIDAGRCGDFLIRRGHFL